MTKDSICWATGVSVSVSESSALGELPFFLPCCLLIGCSAVGVRVREMGAGVSRSWPGALGSEPFLDAVFGLVVLMTGLGGHRKRCEGEKGGARGNGEEPGGGERGEGANKGPIKTQTLNRSVRGL